VFGAFAIRLFSYRKSEGERKKVNFFFRNGGQTTGIAARKKYCAKGVFEQETFPSEGSFPAPTGVACWTNTRRI